MGYQNQAQTMCLVLSSIHGTCYGVGKMPITQDGSQKVKNRENLRIRHLSFGRMMMEKSLWGCWLLGAYCVTPGFLKRKPSLGSLSCIPLPPTMSKRTRRGII